MAKFGIGQAVTRTEDRRLLTGRGRYNDDVPVAGAAAAVVLRSPMAHGVIRQLDAEAARRAPGVLAVLTGEDVAADGLGHIPCLIPIKNRDGSERGETPRPILAQGRVRHVGDPLALVVAETLAQARDAAELVDLDIDELLATTDTVASARPGAPRVWEAIPGNVCFDWAVGDEAAVDAAFAKAARVVKLAIVNNRLVVNSMEPRGAIGEFSAATGRYTLTTGSQGTHLIRDQLAEQVLRVPKERLRVLTGDVGGGFGMKAFLYPEQCLVLWAARRTGRTVKWAPDRSDAFVSDVHGRDNVSQAELALDAAGRFLALKVTTHANLGAYLSNFGPYIPTNGATMVGGLYRIPAIFANVKGVLTNSVPVDAYRGAGRPEAAYLIERLVDAAGRESGFGPAEIRRRNFLKPSDLPYRTPMGDVIDSGEFERVMDECMRAADWVGFEARRAEAKRRGRLRGIGMASYVERCSGGFPETAQLRFNPDDSVTIVIGTQHNGQGHETSYRQILSHVLGIDAERIHLLQGDSDVVPFGLTGGSRSIPVGGSAVLGAAEKVIERGKQVAGDLLETAAVDIEFSDGRFRVAGTDRSVTLFEVAKGARERPTAGDGALPGLDQQYTHSPQAPTFPNGSHICEVEVDPETGRVELMRYCIVDDFGGIVNPLLLIGQVHGGIVQGLGQALCEGTVYEPGSGQLLTGSFMDYAMPRADLAPSFEFQFHNVPTKANPLGIKGSGEAGAVGAPPAVMNALIDALHAGAGVRALDMPATPLRVWQALNAGKAA
ncbi:MAG: xanthine dehydrogenase family protein molybdopterin-binding subunit [Alphaproteobacteria bacterium]|nr:xanthine dehydrogenase family protein molybdopterin-binding subunit [Alphaproteobacteria bacterium]